MKGALQRDPHANAPFRQWDPSPATSALSAAFQQRAGANAPLRMTFALQSGKVGYGKKCHARRVFAENSCDDENWSPESILMYAVVSGFLTSLSLIVAFGAQNVFVLRQGLIGKHVFWLCVFCSASDVILITIGVSGFSTIVSPTSEFGRLVAFGAAAFLFGYGAIRLRAAWIGGYDLAFAENTRSLGSTLAIAAAFTWANPHVYLDTVVLIGAVSTTFPDNGRWLFGAGAIAGSIAFFFTLGYGARHLAPAMQSPAAWRALDTGIGLLMWWLAASLLVRY